MKNLLEKIWNIKQYIVLVLIGIVALSFIAYAILGEEAGRLIAMFDLYLLFVVIGLANIVIIADVVMSGAKNSLDKTTALVVFDLILIYIFLIK